MSEHTESTKAVLAERPRAYEGPGSQALALADEQRAAWLAEVARAWVEAGGVRREQAERASLAT